MRRAIMRSPQAAQLKAAGIEPLIDHAGVGANLQDHLQIRPIYKVNGIKTLNTECWNVVTRAMMGVNYALFRKGPLTMAPSQVGAFVKSSPEYETANLEFHFQPLSLDDWGQGLHRFGAFTASVCNLRPTSRGSIHLSGPLPEDTPDIRPNYLSTEADRQVAVDSLKWARKIVFQKPMEAYRPEEYKPGAHIASQEEMLVAAGDLGTTIFHPVGTAKMGTNDDAMAVLDERLRVRGIEGLRVIDASVMPAITSGNTNSPTIMIADKGAEMIITLNGSPCSVASSWVLAVLSSGWRALTSSALGGVAFWALPPIGSTSSGSTTLVRWLN